MSAAGGPARLAATIDERPMPLPTRTQQIGWFVLLTVLLALVILRWLRLA